MFTSNLLTNMMHLAGVTPWISERNNYRDNHMARLMIKSLILLPRFFYPNKN